MPAPAPAWVAPAIIGLATIAAFLPGVFGEFVGWDDDRNFLELRDYRGLGLRQLGWMWTAFHMGHYTPLTWITLGFDYLLWGMNPLGYHLTSLVIHAAAAATFFYVARRLLRAALGNRVSEGPLWIGAAGSALIFAVHPLRVESVVWLSERRDVLSGLFYLLTVVAYLRAVERPGTDQVVGVRRAAWHWTAVGLFLCAILSKALVVSLPLVLVILDVYPLRRLGGGVGWVGPEARRVWREKIPFVVLAGAGALVAFQARAPLRAAVSLADFDLIARAAVVFYSLAFYLLKTIWPVGLSPLYEMPRLLVLLSPSFILSTLAVVALAGLAVTMRHRWPALAAAACAYVVTLIPVSGIVQSGPQITADRYTYLACLGWAVLAGAGLAWCAERWRRPPPRPVWPGAVLAGATLLIVVAVGLTARQSLVWHDSHSVWNRVLAMDPDSPRGHTGLAGALFAADRVEEAARLLDRALTLNPALPEALMGRALTLGVSGRSAEAVTYAQRAVVRNPLDSDLHYLFGLLLGIDGRPKEALVAFREAARLDPRSVRSRYSIATKLAELGRRAEALAALDEAEELARSINPGDPENDRLAATFFTRLGDAERARPRWQRYMAWLGTLKAPNPVQQARMVEALRSFDQLELGSGSQPAKP